MHLNSQQVDLGPTALQQEVPGHAYCKQGSANINAMSQRRSDLDQSQKSESAGSNAGHWMELLAVILPGTNLAITVSPILASRTGKRDRD